MAWSGVVVQVEVISGFLGKITYKKARLRMRSVLVLHWKGACSPRWLANVRGLMSIAKVTDRFSSLRAVLAGPDAAH